MTSRWRGRALITVVLAALILPRLPSLDAFAIQDEVLWLTRSHLYVHHITEKNWDILHQYPPYSLHPGATLLPVVGLTVSSYAAAHGIDGLFESWTKDQQRGAAATARGVVGLVGSALLAALFVLLKRTVFFSARPLWSATAVIFLGLEPWVWGISRTIHLDAFLSFFLLLAIVASVLAWERSTWKRAALAGIFWGLAFATKSPAVNLLPVVLLPLVLRPRAAWRTTLRQLGTWGIAAAATIFAVWPPMWFHPILRLQDILRDMFSHVAVPEVYAWPQPHLPLFLTLLSIMAGLGCVLYTTFRVRALVARRWDRGLLVTDLLLLGGVLFAVLLVAVGGDHARKNLPLLALFAVPGAMGWLLFGERLRVFPEATAAGLIALQLALALPWFPHLPSFHNPLLRSPEGKRLLVDIGNGSRLVAEYFNAQPTPVVFATNLPGLVQPYLTEDRRDTVRRLPKSGNLTELPSETEFLVIPESFPARVNFDRGAAAIISALAGRTPLATLSIRDVPLFSIFRAR